MSDLVVFLAVKWTFKKNIKSLFQINLSDLQRLAFIQVRLKIL